MEYILPVDSTESSLVEKFQEVNDRDRLGFNPLSVKNADLKKRYHAIINIGDRSFIKSLEKKERRDVLREVVCIILDKIPAINWK